MRERMGPKLSRLNKGGSLTRTGYASVPPTANKTQNITVTIKVLQYTGGHDLFSIGRRRSPAVSTADIPLVSQGAFFQHIHASEPEH